jgi:hypothetical protein
MIFYNPTQSPVIIDLGVRQYEDLDRNLVQGSLTLQPFTSKILVDTLVPELLDVYLPFVFR